MTCLIILLEYSHQQKSKKQRQRNKQWNKKQKQLQQKTQTFVNIKQSTFQILEGKKFSYCDIGYACN